MKITLTLLALSMKLFSQNEYVFQPKGNFTITVIDAGPYYLTGFQLQNGNIYSVTENDYILYGTVEKLINTPETYIIKLNERELSSVRASLNSIERYEIFDEQGLLIGHIRGNFSSNTVEPFLFFDSERGQFAEAILDPSHTEITIRSSDGNGLVICSKTFKYPGFTADPDYYWTIQGTSVHSFDARYLWPFVAFASEVWWRNTNMGGYN